MYIVHVFIHVKPDKLQEFREATELKPMVEMDLEMELGDVENYTKHSQLASPRRDARCSISICAAPTRPPWRW